MSKRNYILQAVMRATLKKIKSIKQTPNFTAYLSLAIVCIFWGTTWVASTYSVRQGISAMQVVSIRQFFAGFILLFFLLIFHKGKLNWPTWKNTFFLAILNFVFSNGLSTWGVQYLPAGFASIIGASYPLWLVLIYYFFFKKEISKAVWTGMLICFIGLVFVFIPNIVGAEYRQGFWFGLALSIFSTITWSVGNIYTKKQTTQDVNPYLSLSLQMIISSIIITAFLYPANMLQPWSEIPMNVWYGIAYLVVAGSLIAYVCYLYAMKQLPAEQVSIYAYVNPMVALFISSIFMGEKATPLLLFGTCIVLFGLYKLNRAFKSVENT